MIVHGRDLLLNEQFPDKFRKIVNQKLEARGIELILGDYVAEFPGNGGGEVVFCSGRKLQADLVVRKSPYYSFPTPLLTGYCWPVMGMFLVGSHARTQTKYSLDI